MKSTENESSLWPSKGEIGVFLCGNLLFLLLFQHYWHDKDAMMLLWMLYAIPGFVTAHIVGYAFIFGVLYLISHPKILIPVLLIAIFYIIQL